VVRVTTVLVVEDDPAISGPLSRALQRQGYGVLPVATGAAAVAYCAEPGAEVALVILDLGLPDLDGLEVCRRIRASGREVPVLMLTARTDEADFVVGLDAGADDYVAKPFRMAELLARVRALLRRRVPVLMDIGGVRVDAAARRVEVDGVEIALANKEFELLRVMMSRAGQVVTREEILAEVWNDPSMKTSKTLDMHMSWLRRKLASARPAAARASEAGSVGAPGPGTTTGADQRISTVRGVGFRFETD
jgi:DNA-binding response OmpR family regulator